MQKIEHDYIYDWNELKKRTSISNKKFELYDETLRDGLQSPSVTDPDVDKKLELLELMEQLGISCADIGLPGAGSRAKADVLAMAKAMSENNFKIKATCAARTKVEDIELMPFDARQIWNTGKFMSAEHIKRILKECTSPQSILSMARIQSIMSTKYPDTEGRWPSFQLLHETFAVHAIASG